MPETCGVALRLPEGDIGLWRPADRHVFRLAAPAGWLGGTGLWSPQGRLHLPYATPEVPCGIVGLALPDSPPPPVRLDPPPQQAPRPVPLQQAPCADRPSAPLRAVRLAGGGACCERRLAIEVRRWKNVAADGGTSVPGPR